MSFFEKLKVIFVVTILLAGFVILIRLSCERSILRKAFFPWDNKAANSSEKHVRVTSRSKFVSTTAPKPVAKKALKKVPFDHPYAPILYFDNETRFLDPEVRNFLRKTRFYAFATKYKKVFYETLVEFDRIWRQKLNRTYILYGGTLLGAYRHGRTIPWDDDLDILVDVKHNKTLDQDFKGSKFTIAKKAPFRKLFFTHNGTTTNRHGHWPFIDLFYFKTRKKGKEIKVLGYELAYPTKYVFPVTQIPHEDRMFMAPRCPKEIARLTAGSTIFYKCCSSSYNHKLDKFHKTTCISCSKLHGVFHFVKWRRLNATHSQQMISAPPSPDKMAAMSGRKKENWQKGPVVFMPEC